MKYDSYKTPRGDTFAKPKRNGCYSLDNLLDDLEANTSFKRADGMGVVSFIADYLCQKLSEGASVTLDGIGTFGVSLQVGGSVDESDLTGNRVGIKRVTFRATPQFKADITAATRFSRVLKEQRNDQTPRYTVDQRMEKLNELLAMQPEFCAKDYETVTGLSRTTANDDLRRYVRQGLIGCRSVGHTNLYYSPRAESI